MTGRAPPSRPQASAGAAIPLRQSGDAMQRPRFGWISAGFGPYTLIMIGPEEIGSGVAPRKSPNDPVTLMPEYVTDIRYSDWPFGQAKSPWLGGPVEIVAVTDPFLTRNVPLSVSEVETVSLFPAFGWFPPLFQHW